MGLNLKPDEERERAAKAAKTNPKPIEETHTLGWHLVAFLDVLGQRERFRQLRLPKTPEEHTAVQGVLRDTVGFVLSLRRVLRSFIPQISLASPIPSSLS